MQMSNNLRLLLSQTHTSRQDALEVERTLHALGYRAVVIAASGVFVVRVIGAAAS